MEDATEGKGGKNQGGLVGRTPGNLNSEEAAPVMFVRMVRCAQKGAGRGWGTRRKKSQKSPFGGFQKKPSEPLGKSNTAKNEEGRRGKGGGSGATTTNTAKGKDGGFPDNEKIRREVRGLEAPRSRECPRRVVNRTLLKGAKKKGGRAKGRIQTVEPPGRRSASEAAPDPTRGEEEESMGEEVGPWNVIGLGVGL